MPEIIGLGVLVEDLFPNLGGEVGAGGCWWVECGRFFRVTLGCAHVSRMLRRSASSVPSPDKVGLSAIPHEIEIVSITWFLQVECLFLSS